MFETDNGRCLHKHFLSNDFFLGNCLCRKTKYLDEFISCWMNDQYFCKEKKQKRKGDKSLLNEEEPNEKSRERDGIISMLLREDE